MDVPAQAQAPEGHLGACATHLFVFLLFYAIVSNMRRTLSGNDNAYQQQAVTRMCSCSVKNCMCKLSLKDSWGLQLKNWRQ